MLIYFVQKWIRANNTGSTYVSSFWFWNNVNSVKPKAPPNTSAAWVLAQSARLILYVLLLVPLLLFCLAGQIIYVNYLASTYSV